MSATSKSTDPREAVPSEIEMGLATQYAEIREGIVKIVSMYEHVQEINRGAQNELLKDLDTLTKKVSQLYETISAIPILHRDLVAIKSEIEKLASDIGDINDEVSAQQSVSAVGEERYKSLIFRIAKLEEELSTLKTDFKSGGERAARCSSQVMSFINTYSDWKTKVLDPALLKVTKLWWGVIAIFSIVGFISIVLGIVATILNFSKDK